jgi:hypothetical protein
VRIKTLALIFSANLAIENEKNEEGSKNLMNLSQEWIFHFQLKSVPAIRAVE